MDVGVPGEKVSVAHEPERRCTKVFNLKLRLEGSTIAVKGNHDPARRQYVACSDIP
jgi:hypothetical protein